MRHGFFNLAVTFMLLHEMDAVRCREWRIFPGLSLLENEVGFRVFMLAHLPLYGLFFRAVTGQSTAGGVIRGLDLFFVVHLVLHLLYLKHPKNEFKDSLSWGCIAGAAVAGLTDLLVNQR
jgi:hypothetical protein